MSMIWALFTCYFSTIAMVAAKDCQSPLGMESGAISDTQIMASNEENALHKAFYARLNRNDGGGGWKAADPEIDPEPFLVVNLGAKAEITGVATQGVVNGGDYVTAYKLYYSNDGESWSLYKTLSGNTNADQVVRNDFSSITAQYVRFTPTDEKGVPAMRVEIYGCFSDTYMASFTGNNYITWDLSKDNDKNDEMNTISLRLKTHLSDGLIFVGYGTQYDYIALQLIGGALLLNINLGTNSVTNGATSVWAGSLMDDNMWHSVTIVRKKRSLDLMVDRQNIKMELNGLFENLNLDKMLMFAGTDNFDLDGVGIDTDENFVGCLEDLQFDGIDIIKSMQDKEDNFLLSGDALTYECDPIVEVPVTFPTKESHLKIKGPATDEFRVAFDFRSFNTDGLLVNNSLADGGFIEVGLREGEMSLSILIGDSSPLLVDSAEILSDGQWHSISIKVDANSGVELLIDDKNPVTIQNIPSTFITNEDYYIGADPFADGDFEGEVPYIPGFVGCMKNLVIGTQDIDFEDDDSFESNVDVVINTCGLTDRCIPNPCENGGVCKQDYDSFECTCDATGYTGSTCHMPRFQRSCEELAWLDNPTSNYGIDPDGSGPLRYFLVHCEIDSVTLEATTTVNHDSEQPTEVKGFAEPGSYMRDVVYRSELDPTVIIDLDRMEALIDNAESCSQLISYECTSSRLLNKGDSYGWWVGRGNMQMDYWGGASPGTNKCACGIDQTCNDPDSENLFCNCDRKSALPDTDSGELSHKDDLPVTQLRFGDTGEAIALGVHTLGPLKCMGDMFLENGATINRNDAFIRFESAAWGASGDLSFYFKTTAISGVMLHITSTAEDFITVELTDANTVKFSYNVGGEVDSLTQVSSKLLNDSEWHRVIVSRNPKDATLQLDSETQQVKDSLYGDLPLNLDSYVYVGAPELQTPGFVGCIRALLINGVTYDLQGMAEEFLLTMPGCVGVCESNPCLNGGKCTEMYGGFECDCAETAFEGVICSDEIGTELTSSGQRVEYDFSPSTTLAASEEETVRLGFQTGKKQGLLFNTLSDSGVTNPGYISINISDQGYVVVSWDLGNGQSSLTDEHNYADDEHHSLEFQRLQTGGYLRVDDYEPQTKEITPSASFNTLNQLDKIYLAGDGSSSAQFQGCLSRVEFIQTSTTQTISVFPLKLAFGGGEVPDTISLLPEGQAPPQSNCGVQGATLPPNTEFPPYGTGVPDQGSSSTSATTGAVIAVVVILVFALILLAAFIAHYAIKNRGDYVTREDEGAKTAPDADMALSKQPAVGKEKEWYI